MANLRQAQVHLEALATVGTQLQALGTRLQGVENVPDLVTVSVSMMELMTNMHSNTYAAMVQHQALLQQGHGHGTTQGHSVLNQKWLSWVPQIGKEASTDKTKAAIFRDFRKSW